MSVEAQRANGHQLVITLRVLVVELPRLSGLLQEAAIGNNSDQEFPINNETDDRSTDNEGSDENDDVDPLGPLWRNISLADLVDQQHATVKRQERMIESLFQPNTEQLSPWESTRTTDKFDMTTPRRYSWGASELDSYLGSLRSNFSTHSHLFSDGDTEKVQYALDHLRSWSNHRDHTLHTMSMIDPITWGQDINTNDSPCLHDFYCFVINIPKMYSEKDHKLNAGTRLYLEFREDCHDSDESVQAYANQVRHNWREAGAVEQQQTLSCYHMICVGLKHKLHPKVKPCTNEDGMLNSIDELFPRAADVEAKPQKYNKWQQQSQHRETSDKGGRKCGYPPSISESNDALKQTLKVDKPKPSSGGKWSDLPPTLWESFEVYEKRKASGKCSHCAGDHISFKWPKYSCMAYPDKLTPGDGNHGGNQHIKKQRSFDTQQAIS